VLGLRPSGPWFEVSNRASFGPFGWEGRLKEEFRLGRIIGSSSLDDSYCDDSHSSFSEDVPPLGLDAGPTTTVSVLAFPLESMVKITSVRGRGMSDSGIDVRLLGL
jgi:hypothetical protein